MARVPLAVFATVTLIVTTTSLAASDAKSSPVGTAANSITFVDERGEDPGAPDVTTAVVSNDDTGRLAFRVNIPNRRTLDKDMRIKVWLLGVRGRDYYLLVDPLPDRYSPPELYPLIRLDRCEQRPGLRVCAPFWPDWAGATSLRFWYRKGVRFSIDAAEIGLRLFPGQSACFKVYVEATAGIHYDPASGYDFSDSHFDRAPSRGRAPWRYTLKLAP